MGEEKAVNQANLISKEIFNSHKIDIKEKIEDVIIELMRVELELILEKKHQTDLPSHYQKIKDKINFIDSGKYKGKIIIQSPNLIFSEIIKFSTDEATGKKIKWKLPQIANMLGGEDIASYFNINGQKRQIRGLIVDLKALYVESNRDKIISKINGIIKEGVKNYRVEDFEEIEVHDLVPVIQNNQLLAVQ